MIAGPGTDRGTSTASSPEPTGSDTGRSHAQASTWERARSMAAACSSPALPAVSLDPADALGCALATPLSALTDLPPFDVSAMDGWAVSGPGPWRLEEGGVLAGGMPAPLADGCAVLIATGARLPQGATAVLRSEHGITSTESLLSASETRRVVSGQDIRPQGEECRTGDALLAAGTTVTPAVLGLAAAAGYDRLLVHRRPAVELLVLGDELLESGLPREGNVRDALSPMLPPWLGRCGADVTGRVRIPDDAGLLEGAIAGSTADVIITTGSTAAGPMDFLHGALARLGARLVVDSVSVRPGHPMLLAELPAGPEGRRRHLVGLPGNPLAAVAGMATLAIPLLRGLGGHRSGDPRTVAVATALPGGRRGTRLLPVTTTANGLAPLAFDGPAMLRGLALADGLAVVPEGGVPAGGTAEFLDLWVH